MKARPNAAAPVHPSLAIICNLLASKCKQDVHRNNMLKVKPNKKKNTKTLKETRKSKLEKK